MKLIILSFSFLYPFVFSSKLFRRFRIKSFPQFSVASSSLLYLSSKIGQTTSTRLSSLSNPTSIAGSTIVSMEERKIAALFGLYVADATAMPVHWMYNLAQLQRDYGRITSFVKPKDRFDGSIMNLSNTGGGGRGSDVGSIIGDVINHGKKKFWVRGGNYHYHLGLEAGENTLEAKLTRLLSKSIVENDGFDKEKFLQRYVEFMTTPGSHNDTYASTCHRMFFANYIQKKPLVQCADNDGHNTDAIDALTLTVPVILHYADAPREIRNEKIFETIQATRKSKVLQQYAENYADILVSVVKGEDLRTAIETHGSKSIKRMVESTRQDPMVACYIDSAYPALLYFAYKYAHSTEEAILASANAGGENVARGSLLGALLGAARGLSSFPAWTEGLKDKEQIMAEISEFVKKSNSL